MATGVAGEIRGLTLTRFFLDSSNLPQFDTDQFEGRIEKPIAKKTLQALGIVFIIIGLIFIGKLWTLQITQGKALAIQSENNRLEQSLLFAPRGVIYDRMGTELVWNVPSDEDAFPRRHYSDMDGLSHVLGYVQYPLKDTSGNYYQEEFIGMAGIEKSLDHVLSGSNGLKIVETDAFAKVQSESIVRPPREGKNVVLSIDASVQQALHRFIVERSSESGFVGGGAVIMDVHTGEVLALTSFPEYNAGVLSDGEPSEQINKYIADERKPFLNRVITGLYTPGSIIKPFIAVGALDEGVIEPDTQILSTGSIEVPNPYVPGAVSVFNDWKAHGLVDMRRAIAVSSNVYFFEVGGGYKEQAGLGIAGIEKYARMFGIGEESGINLPGEVEGVIPNPSWKEKNFSGDPWRIGDTYNTAIGQYGFQVTPIQVVKAVAAIASGGTLISPTLVAGSREEERISVDRNDLLVVQGGMRLAVTEGTGQGLWISSVSVAAKTGTAEIGTTKSLVNSWVIGFFPYESPRYAFAAIMERGPRYNTIGALFVMRQLFEWMSVNTPQYLE